MTVARFRFSFWQSVRNYIVAFYQTQRNALVVIIALALAFYVLTGPDQAEDMISAVINTGPFSALFLFILLSTFVWSWVIYGITRVILHISPSGLQLNRECIWLLRWLPKMGGVIPSLLLAYAFWQPAIWQPYLLILESVAILWGFLHVEQTTKTFVLPKHWHFRYDFAKLPDAIRLLWRHPLGKHVVRGGVMLTVLLLTLFCLPVSWKIAQSLRPTAILIFGIAVFTFWGGLLAYFNDFRYRPLLLLVLTYFMLASIWNDNTAVRTTTSLLLNDTIRRPTVKAHFTKWIEARRQEDQDTIPLVLVAAEGGGIRALNWTAETLIRLDSIIPGFSRHVYALSGVSGGGVGTVFYTAFLRDVPDVQRIAQFDPFRNVIRDDYLSAVSAALLFPDAAQRLIPFPIPFLERAKWLEDSWAASYQTNLHLNTLDSGLTALYYNKAGYNYDLPSLLLNGTLAESGQKTITSNLQLDPHYFTDVVSTLNVLGSDVPLKTAASLCSRFPVLTNGGLIQTSEVDKQNRKPLFSGHVVDGGYFDNTGVETCIQLLNNLVPFIQGFDRANVHIIPYILFIKNSNTTTRRPRERSVLQEVQIPLLAFFNAWDNGSTTRDNMFNSFMDRFTNPKTNYLTIRLAYRDRYPLGWFLSDHMARSISRQAEDSINLKNKELGRLDSTFRRLNVRRIAP